jgi:segregation and condensation protein B
LSSAKKELSTSSSPHPTPKSASESVASTESIVANQDSQAAQIDEIVVTKPANSKPRRSKPKQLAPQLQPRRPAIKLPAALRVAQAWNSINFDSKEQPTGVASRKVVALPPQLRQTQHWHVQQSVVVAKLPVCKRPATAKLPSSLRGSAHWQPQLRIHISDAGVLSIQTSGGGVNTKRIVEAILFAANRPMTVKQIQQVFPELEQPPMQEIQEALVSISEDYLPRPIGLKQLASGYRFQVKEGLAHWVSRIFEEKPARYSRAALETLAIIAYRQPVTRGEIEDIRGVSVSSGIIQSLLEREWIRVIAHKEVPGRPALFGTTKQFLDYFNLSSVTELPPLEELATIDFNLAPPQQPQQENSERPQTDASADQEF